MATVKALVSASRLGYFQQVKALAVASVHLFPPVRGSEKEEGVEMEDALSLASLSVGSDEWLSLRWDWTEADVEAELRVCDRNEQREDPNTSGQHLPLTSRQSIAVSSVQQLHHCWRCEEEAWLHPSPDLREWGVARAMDLTKADAVIVHLNRQTGQKWIVPLTHRSVAAGGEGGPRIGCG